MKSFMFLTFGTGLLSVSLIITGCGSAKEAAKPQEQAAQAHDEHSAESDIKANLAKLSDEDRPLAEAQGFCAASEEPLGSMGVPMKLMVNDQPVFICCKGCERVALKDPEKTLAKVEKLKAKVKNAAGSGKAEGHSHERGKMLIADAGSMHALLTAHLSKDGNELDIFFETPVSKDPQAVAIAIESFEAQATSGDGDPQTLTFTPAPADERPADEKVGCSHFVAKAGWMKPGDSLLVVAKFMLDGQEVVARWKDFVPQKYAHHVE